MMDVRDFIPENEKVRPIASISMDMKFYDKIKEGRKTRTARLERKANVGDVVRIFDDLYIITERRIYPFERLVQETYLEEGFNTPEEFATELYRIYNTQVYSSYIYSHKFTKYVGEISDQLQCNGKDACFGCSRIYSVPMATGGEIFCHNGNRWIGSWNNAQKKIDIPKRCGLYDGGC
jgi:hypothetical protein